MQSEHANCPHLNYEQDFVAYCSTIKQLYVLCRIFYTFIIKMTISRYYNLSNLKNQPLLLMLTNCHSVLLCNRFLITESSLTNGKTATITAKTQHITPNKIAGSVYVYRQTMAAEVLQ